MLCWWGGAQKAGRDHSQGELTQNGQRDIPAHGMSCSYVNWGEWAGSLRSLLRDGLAIGQWMVSSCVVHHWSFLGFIPLFFFPLLLIIIIIFCFSLITVTKLFLSQSNPRGLLSSSPPHQGQGKVNEGLWGVKLPARVKPWQCSEAIFHQQNTKNVYFNKKLPACLPNFAFCFPKDVEDQRDSKPIVFFWISGL